MRRDVDVRSVVLERVNWSRLLAGRVALVTGGARGIGLGIATLFGAHGARLVLADLDAEETHKAGERLRDAGAQVVKVVGDVSLLSTARRVAEAAIEGFGQLDVLVNNAGGSAGTPKRIEDVTEEDFDRVMAWNVRSAFFCTQAVLPYLKRRGGSIINLGSMAGRTGRETTSPQYSAAKAAILGLTRNLAKHLGPSGVRVNAIVPGYTDSGPRAQAMWDALNTVEVLKLLPLGRRGTVEEVAAAALFLASDASSYITGATLDVNGGFICV